MTARGLPRPLHPGAWWLWALGLATAASTTNNLVLLALLVAVAGYVVAARRTRAPWARAFRASLVLGAVVIVVRLVFEVVFGTDTGPTVLFDLPQVPAAGLGRRRRPRRARDASRACSPRSATAARSPR